MMLELGLHHSVLASLVNKMGYRHVTIGSLNLDITTLAT